MDQIIELKVQKVLDLAKTVIRNQIVLQERAKNQERLIKKLIQAKKDGEV